MHFRSYQTTLHFAFYMYIIYVFMRALLCMLMCTGQILRPFGNNKKPLSKEKKKVNKIIPADQKLTWQMCISSTCGSVHTEVTFYETTLQSVTGKIKFCGVPEE